MSTNPAATTPVCPRHPDRVTYVRCQRCNRPTCGDCQRPAAVGFHCVDCVRQAAGTAPQVRTIFGGVNRGAVPVVVYTLIAINIVSYVLQHVLDTWTIDLLFYPYGGYFDQWRFITGAFLHSESSPLHIAFNMYALWIVGVPLERMLGRLRLVTLYLVSAVGGHVMVLLFATGTDWVTGVVGASGAVFGLFGAILIVLKRLKVDYRGILATIVINTVIGFTVPGISWEGHLGGLLTGLGLTVILTRVPREKQRAAAVWAPLVVVGLLVIAAMIKYSMYF